MTLHAIGDGLAEAAEGVGPAVVGLGRGWGLGSGLVVGEGRVLTTAHNLRGPDPAVTFADGRHAAGTVAGADPDADVAVIAVDTDGAPAVEWAPADSPVSIGDAVIALANPGGRGLRVTPGFVSSAPRSFRGPRGRRVTGAIEHTAPLPRGSSGGPLVDASTRLVGINTVRLEGGLILALPAAGSLEQRVEALAKGRVPARRVLGVAVASPRAARRMRRAVGLPEREGLLVRAVEEKSPAAAAGIARGDLLVSAGGQPIDGIDALHSTIEHAPDGEALTIGVVRGAEERELDVVLGPAEGSPR